MSRLRPVGLLAILAVVTAPLAAQQLSPTERARIDSLTSTVPIEEWRAYLRWQYVLSMSQLVDPAFERLATLATRSGVQGEGAIRVERLSFT